MSSSRITYFNLASVIALMALAVSAQAKTYYVSLTGSNLNDGSFATPFRSIQRGINAATTGDIVEVQPGTYPQTLSWTHNGTTLLKDGVTVRGSGGGETIVEPGAATSIGTRCMATTGLTTASRIEGLTFRNGAVTSTFDGGGAIYNSASSPTIVNCKFTGNSGPLGGAIYNLNCSPIVSSCTFSGNSSDRGPGIYNSNGNPTISNCQFLDNTGRSGGIYNDSSNPRVSDCSFEGNHALGSGGGIYNYKSNPTVSRCTFNNNPTDFFGGGIANDDSAPFVTDCTISNSACHGGGAVYDSGTNSGASSTYVNCTFANNYARGAGGASWSWGNSAPSYINCTFRGNGTNGQGGAIGMYGVNSKIVNCLFTGNTAYGGAALYIDYFCSPSIVNCTFSGNVAVNGGGVMWCDYGATPIITNSILWGNSAMFEHEIYIDPYSAASVPVISHSNIQGKFDAAPNNDGNFSADPKFMDAAHGNFRLLGASPCKDAGDDTALPVDAVDIDGDHNITEPNPFDVDGRTRLVGGHVDIGAFERQPSSQLPAANAGPDQTVDISSGDTIKVDLDGSASSDPDGDLIGHTWYFTAQDGSLTYAGQGAKLSLNLQEGTYVMTLAVSDFYTGDAYDTVTITIIPSNVAPVADAGEDQSVPAGHSGHPDTDTVSVTLDSSGASDPDGDILTYAWDDGQGHSSTDANPEFELPVGSYTFTLTVTDPAGLTSSDTVTIAVTAAANEAPVASASSNGPVTVPHDGNAATNTAAFTLDGSASTDPEHDDLTYEWKEGDTVRGSSASLQLTRTAGSHTFTLTVTDAYGKSDSQDVTVVVNGATNAPPTLTVPADAAVNIGCPVKVQALGTDSDGVMDTLTYSLVGSPSWASMNSGNGEVTLNPPAGTVGTFTVTARVTDPYGASEQKSIRVAVCPILIEVASISKKNGMVTMQLNVKNTDGTIVNNVSLNSAALKGVNTTTVLPILFPQLKQGVAKSAQLKFTGVAAGPAQLIVRGTSSAGPVNANLTVNVP